MSGRGWAVLHGDDLVGMLHRAADGEDPDMLWLEFYANADHESVRRGRVDRAFGALGNYSRTRPLMTAWHRLAAHPVEHRDAGHGPEPFCPRCQQWWP